MPLKTFRDDSPDLLLVVPLTILAAWLRLVHLGEPSLWWDEFITVGSALRPLGDMLAVLKSVGPSDTGAELFPPLTHLLVHVLVPLGKNDVLVRLPSVLFGAAAVPALYFLCRDALGRNTALAAAVLLTFSTYHLHYSREARPYALLVLENLVALSAVYAVVVRRRGGQAVVFGASCLAMLYTSYMAATLIAAQTVWAGLALVPQWRRGGGERRQALATAGRLGLALCAAGAAYLPWVEGQLTVYKLLRDPLASPHFSLDFISQSLREFAAYSYRGAFPVGWILAGLGLAGVASALIQRRFAFVSLMVLWAFTPVAGIFLAKARMELSSRYIITLFAFLLVFAAHFLASAVDALGRRLFGDPPVPLARLTVTLALALYLSRPCIDPLPEYYTRETSYYKPLMAYLAQNTNNQDTILFYHPRNLKLAYDWYAAGLLRDVRTLSGTGYRRAFLLAPSSVRAGDRLPDAVFRTTVYENDVLSLGVVRGGVLPLAPDPSGRYVYADDFSTFKMVEDALEAVNVAPSLVQKNLTPYDAGAPGHAVWRFAAPEGRRVRSLKLTVEYSSHMTFILPVQATATLSLGRDLAPPEPVDRAALADFLGPDGKPLPVNHERKASVTRSLDLTQRAAGAATLDVRLDLGGAVRGSPINLENIRLEATLDGPPASPADQPLAVFATLARAVPLAAWTPGADLVLSQGLHAFSLDETLAAPGLQGPRDLAAYLAAHPGAKPVRRVAYPDGRPALALYDPALADPFLSVIPGRTRVLETVPPGARTIRALKLRGGLDAPVLELAGSRLALPVTCPAPAELTVAPEGRAELAFSPLFTADALDMGSARGDNIARNPDEDCLSCSREAPCSLTYAVSSRLPITGFRLTAFPRIFSDPGRRQALRTLYSTDGVRFVEANVFASTGSGRWEGWKIPQITWIRLDTPAENLFIRFELTGQKAQLWSAPDARMRLEAELDASSLTPSALAAWPTALGLTNARGPLDVLLLDAPQDFADRFKRAY